MSNDHPALRAAMAKRHVRLAHLLWHQLRDDWNRLAPAIQARLAELLGQEWVPPRRALDARGNVILGDGAGRDFLWMHRCMIANANEVLKGEKAPPVWPWPEPPGTGHPDTPPPSVNLPPRRYVAKRDACWIMWVRDARKFQDLNYLRSVSIDELGTRIEYGIHAAMHQRFGSYSEVHPDRPPVLRLASRGPGGVIDLQWDNERYDSLLDPYASHVNPLFWKIHAWIDARIDDWERANMTTVDWTGAWTGGMHHCGHHGPPSAQQLAILGEAAAVLSFSGSCGSFLPRLRPGIGAMSTRDPCSS